MVLLVDQLRVLIKKMQFLHKLSVELLAFSFHMRAKCQIGSLFQKS